MKANTTNDDDNNDNHHNGNINEEDVFDGTFIPKKTEKELISVEKNFDSVAAVIHPAVPPPTIIILLIMVWKPILVVTIKI